MKTYVIGLDERADEKGNHYYAVPCGTHAYLQLDGRENIHYHIQYITACMLKRGFSDFIIIRVNRMTDDYGKNTIYRHTGKTSAILD